LVPLAQQAQEYGGAAKAIIQLWFLITGIAILLRLNKI
jgi:hypothetical protein